MNERRLRRFLKYLVLLSVPLPVAYLSAACAGSSGLESAGAGGESAAAGGAGAGAGGESAVAGGAGAGAGDASTGGSGGNPCHGVELLAQPYCDLVNVPPSCIDPAQAIPRSAITGDPGCAVICDSSTTYCTVQTVAPEAITVGCGTLCGVAGGGRRPAGLCVDHTPQTGELGGYFAELARLEAASVNAFRILRDELWQHGAPKKLVRAAGRAARDEVRHARATAALARRFGAQPRPAQVEPIAPRSLEAMALENAVEGCVRETFGALQATWQARVARDPVVRSAMTRIARDETRHAALSFSVARWLEQRLTNEGRRRVETAKRESVRELMNAASSECASYAEAAGLPNPQVTELLVQQMQQTLWC